MQEVSLKVVTCDEECTIKMFDFKSGGTTSVLILEQMLPQSLVWSNVQGYEFCAGALFAECIVPQDAPMSTVDYIDNTTCSSAVHPSFS